MKKIISIIISLMIAVCSVSITCFTASAAFVGSVETTTKQFDADVTVNGRPSIDGKYEIVDPNEETSVKVKVEFTYSGDEPLQYWEVEGLTEDVDYVIISDSDNKLIIGILNNDINYVKANAVTAIDSEEATVTVKVNNDRKSPDTGADLTAVAASASIVAGAAVAIVAKKKSK